MILNVVEGVPVEALIDTGASVSVINHELCSRLRKITTTYDGPTLLADQGAAIRPTAICTARISIDRLLHYVELAFAKFVSPAAHNGRGVSFNGVRLQLLLAPRSPQDRHGLFTS